MAARSRIALGLATACLLAGCYQSKTLLLDLAQAAHPFADGTWVGDDEDRTTVRLEKRGQDAPDVIARRLDAAREEMRHCGEFDYVIMNQDFARAVDDLSVIVRAARLTASRQQVRHAALLADLLHT